MKVIYKTKDNLYVGEDVMNAFVHAFNLGRSDWQGDPKKAYAEWANEYMNNSLREPTLNDITNCVANVLGTSSQAILDQSVGRSGKIAQARIFTAYFAYMYTSLSLYEIADELGYKNHSSIIYSSNRVMDQIELSLNMSDPTKTQVSTVVNMIKAHLLYRGCKVEYKERVNWVLPPKIIEV